MWGIKDAMYTPGSHLKCAPAMSASGSMVVDSNRCNTEVSPSALDFASYRRGRLTDPECRSVLCRLITRYLTQLRRAFLQVHVWFLTPLSGYAGTVAGRVEVSV